MAGSLFGRGILAVANRPAVASFAARSAITRGLVSRFVAGEALEDALAVTRQLNGRGIGVALDHLGENTTSAAEAQTAADEAIRALERVESAGLDAYISVKLTQLGLDLGEHVVLRHMRRLLRQAHGAGRFVRVDMEGSEYTGRTIELFSQLRKEYDNIGIVIQAYLYRSMADLRSLVPLGASVRLCKGAYREPPHIAFRRKRDTDRNFLRLMEYLLLEGHCPAIATHDAAIIDRARRFAQEHAIAPGRFEFEMLYGVRRDLQDSLLAEGYRVRVYVPYGSQWYPYLTRRLAERPANLFFMLGSLVRERRPAPAAAARRVPPA